MGERTLCPGPRQRNAEAVGQSGVKVQSSGRAAVCVGAHLKGCREPKISWDWETGSPPLSPSWAWACRGVCREMGICWAAAACGQKPAADQTPSQVALL